MTKKSKVLEELIRECNVKPELYFDKLSDLTESHLSKLLRIAKGL